MAVCTVAGVLASFRTRWAAGRSGIVALAGSTFATLWWWQRPGPSQAWPCGVLRVTEDGAERSREADGQTVLAYLAELTVWTAEAAADPAAYAAGLGTLFDGTVANRYRGGLVAPTGSAVLSCVAVPGALTLSRELVQGNDLLAAAGRWRVTVGTTEG